MSTNWDNASELLTKAQTARAQGDREMAYQFYARASELSPQDASAWQGRAETATLSDEALISYAYASALDANNQPLAKTLDAALTQRVQASERADVPVLIAMGQELAQVGLTDKARILFTRAWELDTTSTDALIWLAGTAPDDQTQLDYLQRAMATNPNDPRARAGILSVKLPPPPTPSKTPSTSTATPSRPMTITPEPSATTESASMERLRQLRTSPTVTQTAQEPLPPADDVSSLRAAASKDNTMRNLLLGLLAVVAILAILGVILLQMQ